MAENDKVLEPEVTEAAPEVTEKSEVKDTAPAPDNKNSFGAKFREWGRKKIVALKRSPQTITLVLMAITTIFFMLALFNISQAISSSKGNENTPATGICLFITTLLSLLYLVSFLNAFPKRKKPNIFFIVLVFVMIAGMIASDLVYYCQMANCIDALETGRIVELAKAAQPLVMAHIVLLALCAIVFALLPVYGKLINKINTKVELESATENMKSGIDIQED